MGWILIGIVVVFLIVLFLSLFFGSSGAMTIAEEERSEIEQEPPEQLAQELIEAEKEDAEALRKEEDNIFSSRG